MASERDRYNTDFPASVVEKALELAHDTRKFEIGLYWQRTAYFWALIAAAFAGYFAVLTASDVDERNFNAFLVACIGFAFSLAWFRVNRGSKYWQENWERHVDMLENTQAGPLYKTILQAPAPKRSILERIDGGSPVSVSRVNQWVSLYIIAVWTVLAFVRLPAFNTSAAIDWRYAAVIALTAVFSLFVALGTKSRLAEKMDEQVIHRELPLQ